MRHYGVLSKAILQLKDRPLSTVRKEISSQLQVFSRCDMTDVDESDIKTNSFFPLVKKVQNELDTTFNWNLLQYRNQAVLISSTGKNYKVGFLFPCRCLLVYLH